jgi:hypothetical protein
MSKLFDVIKERFCKRVQVPDTKPTKQDSPITQAEFIERAIELYDEYREYFGLSDETFPEDEPQDKQCEFEEKFVQLICAHQGHNIEPDMCGKYNHDFCYRCMTARNDIVGYIKSDWRDTYDTQNNR